MAVIFTEETSMNWIFYFSIIIAIGVSFSQAEAWVFKRTEPASTETGCTGPECVPGLAGSESKAAGANRKDLLNVTKKIAVEHSSEEAKLALKIKKYSDSPQVKETIAFAIKNKKSMEKLCYRAVKKALLVSRTKAPNLNGLIPNYFDDEAAANAKKSLKQFGFINLLEKEPYRKLFAGNPSMAPKGAVLVYSSGIRCRRSKILDCGHIEIKMHGPGKDGYIAEVENAKAISDRVSRYKLTGVMIKDLDFQK